MKLPIIGLLIAVLSGLTLHVRGQYNNFDPKGNPGNWNYVVTPFFLLPNIRGEVQSKRLSQDFGIGPSKFVETLNGAFMMAAEVSKGKFFVSPAYIYTHNGVQTILWTNGTGTQTIKASPALKKNIVEMKVGVRLRLEDNLILDPYVGFRYTNYHLYGPVEGIVNTSEIDEQVDFWDPIAGVLLHYFPHPRVPVEVRTDIGGFGVGSEITWSTMLHGGYVISQRLDLIAGFAALSNRYVSNTHAGNAYEMNSVIYGFDMGVRVYFPKRGVGTVSSN